MLVFFGCYSRNSLRNSFLGWLGSSSISFFYFPTLTLALLLLLLLMTLELLDGQNMVGLFKDQAGSLMPSVSIALISSSAVGLVFIFVIVDGNLLWYQDVQMDNQCTYLLLSTHLLQQGMPKTSLEKTVTITCLVFSFLFFSFARCSVTVFNGMW